MRADREGHRVVLGGEGGDMAGQRGRIGEGTVAEIGPAIPRRIGLRRDPEILGMPGRERFQRDGGAAMGDAGGQGARGRIDLGAEG